MVGSVVITQYVSLPVVDNFKRSLERMGIKVYLHYFIEGYPNDVDLIVSEKGYGQNEYIETENHWWWLLLRDLVLVRWLSV